ncbi:integrin alpha-11-like [Styela clava]
MNNSGSELMFILFLLAVLSSAAAFNVDISSNHIGIISSPDVNTKLLTVQPSSNIADTTSYFGYTVGINMVDINNITRARLLVGSPLHRATNRSSVHPHVEKKPEGGIYECKIENIFVIEKNDSKISSPCVPIHPEKRLPGDVFGKSVSSNPDGEMTACSATRGKNCSSAIHLPGFCYRSSDFGETWNMDKRSRNAACGVETVDVMFVLDGSASVVGHFQKIKDFATNITALLDIEKGTIHVGVIQYSTFIWKSPQNRKNYIKTELKLGEFQNLEDFQEAMSHVNISMGGTMTGAALKKVVDDFTQSERYNSSTNNQVMILLTDGRSIYSKRVTLYAQQLRDIGVVPYAVGVGQEIDDNELRVIATGTDTDVRVYRVENFEGLNDIVEDFQSEILSFQLESSHHNDNASFKLEVGETGFSSHYGAILKDENNNTVSLYLYETGYFLFCFNCYILSNFCEL